MKKIISSCPLITILFTMITHNASGMDTTIKIAKLGISGACSLTELFVTAAPIMSTLFMPRIDLTQKQKPVSNTPEEITSLVTDLATQRGVKNITVIADETSHDYNINDVSNILYIPREKAQELQSLLNNQDRTQQEDKMLHEHIGSIHHELSHSKRQSLIYVPIYEASIGTTAGIATSGVATALVKKCIPYIYANFALRNAFKLTRAGLTFTVIGNIFSMNFYKKYDELQADEEIPNKKELLGALAEKYENRHNNLLACVSTIKKNANYSTIIYEKLPDDQFNRKQLLAMKILPAEYFNNPWVSDIIFNFNKEHPSDIRRAVRFKKRIADLETDKKES